MFDRFTDRAKKVMSFARQQAIALGHERIDTEHLLLGLLQEGSGVAANVLKTMGIDLAALEAEVEQRVERGRAHATGQLPFAPLAKRVLEMSLEQASQLAHNYIGTEHLLLGMLRTTDSVAAQALQALGVAAEAARTEVLAFLGDAPAQSEQAPSADAAAVALRSAAFAWMRRRASRAGSHALVVLPKPGADDPTRETALAALVAEVIVPALRAAGIAAIRTTRDLPYAEHAGVQLAPQVLEAAVVLVVCVGRDPDVLFALGVGHAFLRDPIVLAEHAGDLPHEMQATAFLGCTASGRAAADLCERLTTAVRRRLDRDR